MRRLMIMFVVGCTALGLGLGLMLNSNSPGSSNDSASRSITTQPQPTTSTTARVLGGQVTRSTIVTATPPTTSVNAAAVTTTTRAAAVTTTRPTTTTTRRPASTPTTKPAAAKKPADCGTGDTSASVSGSFNPEDQLSHLVATVDNHNTKAIVVDKLTVHLVYSDGTQHTVTVPNAAGSRIDTNAKRTFEFTDSASGATLTSMDIPAGGFGFHVDGQPTCAST